MQDLLEDLRRLSGLDSLAKRGKMVSMNEAAPAIVSPDNYLLTKDGEYVWSPDRVKEAWRKSYEALKARGKDPKYNKVVLMVGIPASGKSTWIKNNKEPGAVYFDATFTNQRARKPVIKMAKDHGMKVDAVVMDTPINVCKDRNSCRTTDRAVPDDVIERMASQLAGDPPKMREGFDNIRRASKSP